MDNKRVGFAESVYSDLSEHQSTAHTNQILLNMSSYEKTEYFFESAGFDHGPEILVCTLLSFSILCGALLANCLLKRSEEDSETKQARKVLADVLNEGNTAGPVTTENDMFDVPLNDDRSYVGPDVEAEFLSSQTRYAKVAAKPSKKQQQQARRQRPGAGRFGNLTEDDEYSFDVEQL